LDDSNVATEAGEVSEETQEILSGHKRSSFFAADMGRFYSGSGGATLRAG